MKVIDRYLAWAFTRNFLVVLGIVTCLILVSDVIDSLGEMLENDTSLAVAMKFFLVALPEKVLEVVPMTALVASLFTVGGLARNNEILAMLTGGVSIYRVALPFAIVGLIVSLGSIILGETVVPDAQKLANSIERQYIDGKLPRDRNKDIVANGVGEISFAISNYRYDKAGEVMQQVTIWEMDETRWHVKRRLDAQRGVYVGDAKNGKTIWKFTGAIETLFDFKGGVDEVIVHPPDDVIERRFSANLNVYLRDRQKPEEMNFKDLRRYIGTLSKRGNKTANLETDLHLKIAYPLSAFLLVLLGIYCGMHAQGGSLVVGFGIGLVLGLSYYFLTATSRAFGHAGLDIPAAVFAWSPTAVFAVLSVALLIRTGKPR